MRFFYKFIPSSLSNNKSDYDKLGNIIPSSTLSKPLSSPIHITIFSQDYTDRILQMDDSYAKESNVLITTSQYPETTIIPTSHITTTNSSFISTNKLIEFDESKLRELETEIEKEYKFEIEETKLSDIELHEQVRLILNELFGYE